jgi:hypothetical protein
VILSRRSWVGAIAIHIVGVMRAPGLPAQEPPLAVDASIGGALYDELARVDSVLFDAAFVSCNLPSLDTLLAPDIEFVHDQSGFQSGDEVRATFRQLTDNCPGHRGVTRELVPGSLRVFPIHNYGAVQTGSHRFVTRGASSVTVAHFVHLWHHVDAGWVLARVLSFDHRAMQAP